MHFRLGNYDYTGGKYLPLAMKGSRHRGWIKLGSHKPCKNTKHVFGLHTVIKIQIFRNRNKYKKDHTIFVVGLALLHAWNSTQKEIRLRESEGRQPTSRQQKAWSSILIPCSYYRSVKQKTICFKRCVREFFSYFVPLKLNFSLTKKQGLNVAET